MYNENKMKINKGFNRVLEKDVRNISKKAVTEYFIQMKIVRKIDIWISLQFIQIDLFKSRAQLEIV